MATTTRELAFPISVDSTGSLATVTSLGDIAAAHVRSVLGTQVGERVMRATYGTHTVDHLFEDLNDAEIGLIRKDVADALAEFAPEVQASQIGVEANESTVSITVQYSLNDTTEQSVTVTTVSAS